MNKSQYEQYLLDHIKAVTRQTFEAILEEVVIKCEETISKTEELEYDYELDIPEIIKPVMEISMKNFNKLLQTYKEINN